MEKDVNEAEPIISPEFKGLICLKGSIENVIFTNEENGFSICDLGTEENELVTITGILPYVAEGDQVKVWGKWVHNPKYGRQFKAEQCEKELPTNAASILRYLSSGAIKGIKAKTAQKIVDEFGEETFTVLEEHPDWIAGIPGISPKRARAIGEEFRNQAGMRVAMMFFRDFFGPAVILRIYKRYGSRAVDLARHNPYRLCEEIEGVGFERADKMALQLGLQREGEERVCAGICYLFTSTASQSGHVCLPLEKAVEEAAKLLEIPEEAAAKAIKQLIQERKLKTLSKGDTVFVYDYMQYESEQYIAKKLLLLQKLCPPTETANIQRMLRREELESGIEYASLQRQAIADALENGVMLLTGGPGTGKTTVVRALLHIFSDMDFKIALAAPTGRAAKRLSESTSCEAKTIHRLLEYGKEEGGRPSFHRNESNLLSENVIIIDEVSMVDNALMCALLKAVKPGARVIFIGDADQLPSVGAGNVLHDLLESNRFATVRLTEIFRQAQKSLIITNAHAINRGEMPKLDCKDNDFFFLMRNDDSEAALTVAQLCAQRLPKTYGELAVNGTQVICPSRKGESGTENLNRILQQALNPANPNKREYAFRDLAFREGDRIMQIRNNYDIEWERLTGGNGNGIFNGDIGVIEEICPQDKYFRIRFEDKIVNYDISLLEDLEMAYAITVHKSQGSEYPIVILPMGDVPPMLLSRNLFYTAVTRAESIVILVGKTETVAAMVHNCRQSLRYTGLCYQISEMSK